MAAACIVTLSLEAAVATEPVTLVVDDDGAQCEDAGFATIGDAVAAANAGDTVKVCAGLYRERVDVTKQLRLIGQRDAVEGIACVDEAWSPAVAVDPTVLPVMEPPDGDIGSLFRLQANGGELAGFVVQGLREPTPVEKTVFTPAIQADGANAGHWLHHNLIQDNTLGIELGSNGSTLSRVDHNCLRGNDWALANQRYTTAAVRVDHNDAYRTRWFAFEVGTYAAGISDARFDHNRTVSSGDAAYLVERAESVRLDHNIIEAPARNGVTIRGANQGVEVSDNRLVGAPAASFGITLSAPIPAAPTPSTAVVLTNNTVERFNIGILLALNAMTTDTQIFNNVTVVNRASGIQVSPTNTSALVQGNVSNNNLYGIRTATPQVMGNSFIGNSMHYNSAFDAVENSFTTNGGVITLNNTWQGNVCDTDSPTDTICIN